MYRLLITVVVLAFVLVSFAIGQETNSGSGAAAYDVFKEPYRTKFLENWEKAVSDLKHQIETSQVEQKKKTAETTKRLAEQRKSMNNKRKWPSASDRATLKLGAEQIKKEQEETKDQTKKLTDRLAELETNNPPFLPYMPRPASWTVGALGRIDCANMTVVQVIGEDKMLVDVVDGVSPDYGSQWVMFSGFSTSRLTDGAGVRIDKPISISKTTTYTTAIGGTKTVLVAEPLDLEAIKASAEEQAARRKQAEEKQQKGKTRGRSDTEERSRAGRSETEGGSRSQGGNRGGQVAYLDRCQRDVPR